MCSRCSCFNPGTHINVTGEITAEEVIGEHIIDVVPAKSITVQVQEEVLVIVVFLYLIKNKNL